MNVQKEGIGMAVICDRCGRDRLDKDDQRDWKKCEHTYCGADLCPECQGLHKAEVHGE